jgi:hypothetical protein
MKYEIVIEETVVDEFEVEADSKEEAIRIAEDNYRKEIFALCPGEVQCKQMAIVSPIDGEPEWIEF